ncbi:cell division protein ZapE [Aliidiomarina iranensis]|uniref:Cell division protein ZapE n=1 Tax=Aliidiomarina iranensis TaxID=1434071 RepID=A0A432W2W7_9GAMM|nr:cell division protein ZapE [Aliidiomarina iranensis]RUO23503.1 cell division protein ZapE [Aliidiomarina iranensis]
MSGKFVVENVKTPLAAYERDLARADFHHDPAQEEAVRHLQRLYEDLIEHKPAKGLKKLSRTLLKKSKAPIKGLYFWGGVGRGKTYLVDTFYNALPFERKWRVHFHRFMHRVHTELKALKGKSDPLPIIAAKFAAEARVICFDEFFVQDITDAMILGTLLEALFAEGVVLVATSNIVPDDLYKNGLQRARFLPAIKLLNQHCEVVNVDGGVDYRLRTLTQAEIYHSPLDEAADDNLVRYFYQLAPEHQAHRCDEHIEINGRNLLVRCEADDVAFFDFKELCEGPRSQNDYIELARLYHAILVSNVPQLGREKDDAVRRFIALVDEFYEHKVKLIISAAVPMQDLYSGGTLNFEFRRCLSRLQEMQSHAYLGLEHLP